MESPPVAKSCFVPDPLNLMIPSGLKEFDELILPNHLSDPKSGNSKQSRAEMNLQYANGSAHLKQVKMESVKAVKNKELVSSSGSAYDGIQRNFEMQEDKHLHGSGPRPFRVTNSQVENEIEDKLSAFASNSSSSKPLIKYRFDTTQIHADLQCLSPNNQDTTTSKQPDPQFTLDSILKYFTTKNLYFECLHYELIGYYLAFVFSLMSLYLAVSSGEKWCHIVVPFLVIDIIMLLRFGNITKKPQITSKVFSLGLSILVHSCLIIYEFWSFASIWFVALLPLGNTIYRIGWNKVQYGPKLMFPYLLIRDVQIFFCTLRLVFGWPSWTGALVFAFGTAVFDICVLALFVFKVAFLIINSIAKKDLKILQNNLFGFEVITIMYKLQSIFLFVLGLKVASYLDLPNSKAKQEASAAAVAVLILTSVFGALIVHYSKYCKMAYADQPNSMMESPITVKQSTTFRSYLAYLEPLSKNFFKISRTADPQKASGETQSKYIEKLTSNMTAASTQQPPRAEDSLIPEDSMCFVCEERRSAALLTPCLHGGLCKKCIFRHLGESSRCPLCKTPLQKITLFERVLGSDRVKAVQEYSIQSTE